MFNFFYKKIINSAKKNFSHKKGRRRREEKNVPFCISFLGEMLVVNSHKTRNNCINPFTTRSYSST